MKISKSMLSKVCTVAGFLVLTQFCFATDIIIRKDNPIPPPDRAMSQPNTLYPVSATIVGTDLTVYFDSEVGIATVTVYDSADQVVSQQTVDTSSTLEVAMSLSNQSSGDYVVRISYGTTHLIGDFQIE